jgi:hypothetical protein
MRPLCTALLAAACLFALPAAASASSYAPPRGQVFWGGQGGYSQRHIVDFAAQSGKHPAVFNFFISWRAREPDIHWLRFRLGDAARQRSRVMLSISSAGSGLSPRAIARGGGDRFLLAIGSLLAEQGGVTYLRPLSEMNNGANPYSPYDLAGRSRGPAFSPARFRQAWRRLALIVRGGEVASIDARLRRLGLPPVRTDALELPRPRVALAWVPLTLGNPEIARNHPSRFWPGSRYVDWVGTTWYSPHKSVRSVGRFYANRLWRRKPFMFAEWGVWGREDPSFVRLFFRFMRSHPRARMAVYFQSSQLKAAFRLSSHPRSRSVLRRAVRWPRLRAFAPEFR